MMQFQDLAEQYRVSVSSSPHQNLMDTKVALDMEIAVFRRLLESEEDRLGILGPEGEKSSLETSQYGLTFT